MKHVAGFPNASGSRTTALALSAVQSRTSGPRVMEQIRIKAVSILPPRSRRSHPPRMLPSMRLRGVGLQWPGHTRAWLQSALGRSASSGFVIDRWLFATKAGYAPITSLSVLIAALVSDAALPHGL